MVFQQTSQCADKCFISVLLTVKLPDALMKEELVDMEKMNIDWIRTMIDTSVIRGHEMWPLT